MGRVLGLAALLGVAWAGGAWAAEPAVTPAWPALTPSTIYIKDKPPATPKLEDLPLKESVTQYGITWTFDKPARVGQFINGDYYVVGPVTVKALDPKPLYGAEIPQSELDHMDKERSENRRVRNGFMLNPPAAMKVAFDSGVRVYFDPALIQKLPVAMKAGDSLVSTISMPSGLKLNAPLRNAYARGEEDASPTRMAAVLTCVGKPQPPDAFRPAFCDRQGKIYLARNLKRELLPTLAAPRSIPKIEQYIGFTQKPWVGTCLFTFAQPMENMPAYGCEYGRVVGIAALLLCTDLKPQEKEPLLVNFVQVGIDLGGMIRAGHPGWEGFGGFASGRKLPIVFAGLLLGDEQMANINRSFPKASFGEDEQTAYGDCWTGAKVVYTGHRGIDEKTGLARPETGPYEHKEPATWTANDKMSDAYRHMCSISWLGEALALRLLKVERTWDHDAFLDYCDRWMYEDDKEIQKKVKATTGKDFSDFHQGESPWDTFVNEMWAKYRAGPGMPATDGWKKPHDDSYLRNAIAGARK
jgi:hypothetical protein